MCQNGRTDDKLKYKAEFVTVYSTCWLAWHIFFLGQAKILPSDLPKRVPFPAGAP